MKEKTKPKQQQKDNGTCADSPTNSPSDFQHVWKAVSGVFSNPGVIGRKPMNVADME